MRPDPRSHAPSYFARALVVVASAAVLHFTLAHILLALLAEGGRAWVTAGPREAVTVIVATSFLVALAAFYLRSQYASPDHVTRSVPWALRIAPPAAAVVVIPLTYDPTLLAGDAGLVTRQSAPVVTAAWASGFMVSILLKRVLHALAIRSRPSTTTGILRAVPPPTVAGGYARILSGAAFSAAVVVVGAVLTRVRLTNLVTDPTLVVVLLSLCIMVAIGAMAGASVGQSPGREVVSIARRLDALGYNARQTMEWPVVVTSLDELGELFSRLELLRVRLAREVAIYQDALDRTREADATKAEFLGAVSHELRTPLNSVCGFAQLLLESGLTEAQTEDVRLIRAGGHQLLELINDILDISMIESGELRLQFSSVDLGELVEETVNIHRPLVRGRDVRLLAEVGPDLPTVECDRRRISQILTNLVSNAIKFTETGTIVVRVARDPRGGLVILRVTDTGLGIASDELDMIFEEYRQVGSVKRRTKGTGLGLAIARSIAVHHGGSLTCESMPDEGSSFILVLPVDPPRKPASIDVTQEAARAVERAKRRTGELPAMGVGT